MATRLLAAVLNYQTIQILVSYSISKHIDPVLNEKFLFREKVKFSMMARPSKSHRHSQSISPTKDKPP